MHVSVKIIIKEKYMLKIKYFLLKIGFNKPNFCQNIDKLWLWMTMISVKLLVFRVKMLCQKMHFLLFKFIKNNN